MITLGITGRSGCGKSTVTSMFAAHGVPLVDADQISREILLPGSPLLPRLAERFGDDILRADGTLDRRLLADRAFAAPEGKRALDALTHPEILRRIRAAKQAAQGSRSTAFCDRRSRDRGHRCGKRVRPPLRGHCALCDQCGPHRRPGRHRAGNGGAPPERPDPRKKPACQGRSCSAQRC